MKTAILILLFIIGVAFLGNTTIQFSPFKITFEKPYFAIGMILIIIGISFIQYQGEKIGRKKYVNELKEMIEEIESENKSE